MITIHLNKPVVEMRLTRLVRFPAARPAASHSRRPPGSYQYIFPSSCMILNKLYHKEQGTRPSLTI